MLGVEEVALGCLVEREASGAMEGCEAEVPAWKEEVALLLPRFGTRAAWKPGRRPRTDGCDIMRG